jgi:uncharacterized cupin superfamily protein
MTPFVHVPASTAGWSRFDEADATHPQLEDLSRAMSTDAVWLVRRDEGDRIAPTQAGLYRMAPGTFQFESPGDEMCFVVSGAAEVQTEDGRVTMLAAGDMVFWPRGQRTAWTVTEEFVQFFTMIG